jgi:hypothetical protein
MQSLMKSFRALLVFLCCVCCTHLPVRAQQSIQANAFGQNLLEFIGRVDFYVFLAGNMYVLPNGVQQPVKGISISSSDISPLVETTWGYSLWFGKVFLCQSLSMGAVQINPPQDSSYRLQGRSGLTSFTIGYSVLDYEIFSGGHFVLRLA